MSTSSVSNIHGDEVSHQVGQPPPPPLPPLTSGPSSHQQHQQKQPVESHYKNILLGKPTSLYHGSQHQGNSNPHGTVYAQRADVWSPVTTSLTTPPPPTPDDELLGQLTMDDLIARIRSLEAKNRKLLYDNGAMTKDINHHLSSLQQLKQQNYHLISENNELRELACFLEDERSRCRSIAREWQSFGTHMSRVMRHEVTNYSNKLTQLEGKQFELVRENFELKQLCLLLDNTLSAREGTEGTAITHKSSLVTSNSNGIANVNPSLSLRSKAAKSNSNTHNENNNENNVQPQHRVILSQQILEYIKSLEDRIQQLETERTKSIDTSLTVDNCETYGNIKTAVKDKSDNRPQPVLPNCPQPLEVAMQALKIQEDLRDGSKKTNSTENKENPSTNAESNNEVITDQHKAIVKGLCNVIWRKIEDSS